MTKTKSKPPWRHPSEAPTIEQSIHDYIVSAFRMQPQVQRQVEIIPISPGAEASRGWDAAIMEAIPLYFQYKLPDFTSKPERTQAAAFAQRKQWMFDDGSGLFHFNLRKKSAHALQSQHAPLVAMQRQGNRVFYVAPTFIDFRRLRFGAEPHHGRAWIPSHISVVNGKWLQRIDVPLFRDLICIPPHADVDGKPEEHQFFFNLGHEVSLHSEPTEVDSQTLQEVVVDQVELLSRRGESVVTRENYREYSEKLLRTLSDNGDVPDRHGEVRDYFESHLSSAEASQRNPLMNHMRSLAKVMKRLAGIDVLLTLRKES